MMRILICGCVCVYDDVNERASKKNTQNSNEAAKQVMYDVLYNMQISTLPDKAHDDGDDAEGHQNAM